MNTIDYFSLSPLFVVLVGALVLLLVELFGNSRRWGKPCALLTVLIALGAASVAPSSDNPLLTSWLRFDAFSYFFTLLFLGVAGGCFLLPFPVGEKEKETPHGEYYFLFMAALFGLLLIGSAADFLTLFLGLETFSIALYVLTGYVKQHKESVEAAIKYFLIGAVATGFLLYGIALLYGATGTTALQGLLARYQGLSGEASTLFLAGIAFVTLGLAFKAALVPFHLWAPDVYEGTSTPVAAFMAVGTKAGAFAAFALIFLEALPHFHPLWSQMMVVLAVVTMLYANAVALRQTKFRPLFAYSGISHAGYLLIPIIVGGAEALPALEFYLVVYAVATLGAFAVIASLETQPTGTFLEDLQGLFYRAPLSAAVLSVCLLVLAGVPPLPGFFAKFYLFKIAFEGEYYFLVIAALIAALLGLFYYVRIISRMCLEKKIVPAH